MGYSPREFRAIQRIAQKYEYKLNLCVRPYVYYKKRDGTTVKLRIREILEEYDAARREEARNRKNNGNGKPRVV